MGVILFIVASVLKWVLTPFAYTYSLIVSISKGETSKYYRELAVAKDKYGNCLCQYLFNKLLIRDWGYKFGNANETISSVLGKNYRDKTMTKLGYYVGMILNLIEPNHIQKSIDEDVD